MEAHLSSPPPSVPPPATPPEARPPDSEPLQALGRLLVEMVEQKASDLHLNPGGAVRFRRDGRLVRAPGDPPDSDRVAGMIAAQMPARHRRAVEESGEVDFSFAIEGVSRYRASVFRCRGELAAVYRVVPEEVPAFDELGLPDGIERFAALQSGLVLTSGPVGSGKSTTLAAIVDRINRTREAHIVTVEDPVEIVHRSRRSLVTQRQVGTDTASFHSALRSILRSDPDVVLIGEIRDRETVDAALRVSEAGHLALATIHARSVLHAMTRVIEMFQASEQRQARTRLAESLEAVYCQRLVRRASGPGRVLVAERMVPTRAGRNLIREDKLHQLFPVLGAGGGRGPTVTLNEVLLDLCRRMVVAPEDALAAAHDPQHLRATLRAARNGAR